MNDLQAQLEEAGKEKQELQEKVGALRHSDGPAPAWHVGRTSARGTRAGPCLCGRQCPGVAHLCADARAPPPPTQLQGLQSQLEFLEQSMVDKSLVSRQEAKIRELETRLEFERTQVKRLEVGAGRGWGAVRCCQPAPVTLP